MQLGNQYEIDRKLIGNWKEIRTEDGMYKSNQLLDSNIKYAWKCMQNCIQCKSINKKPTLIYSSQSEGNVISKINRIHKSNILFGINLFVKLIM